jgi:hypothetical protein
MLIKLSFHDEKHDYNYMKNMINHIELKGLLLSY